MTNKRISALSAATTPLAGTELVPIWDGSTTVYVTIANLTAGRAIATGEITTSDAIRLEYSTPKIWTKHTGSATSANCAWNMSSSNNTVYWQVSTNQSVGEGFEINAGAATNNRMYIDPTTGAMKIPYGLGIGGTAGGAGGIAFPATAVAVADANTLDDYEEYTSASTACTGALLNSVIWRVVKVGQLVTFHCYEVYGTGQTGTSFTLGETLPAAYRPFRGTRLPIVNVIVNNASQANVGVLIVSATTGVMTVYRDATLATSWGSAANTGIEGAFSVSWLTT